MAESTLPSDYFNFLTTLKVQIQQAQLKAVLSVNRELIVLYWHIGKEIITQQGHQGWGAGVIERLSRDLHATFPEMRGFSPRNLGYMKSFAQAYPDETILQQAAANLPWFHNCTLLDRVKDNDERLWYMQKALEHGWSRNILELQIKTDLYHRSGKALTNFSTTIPASDSDLAQDALKDPYVFDFITTREETKERDVQSALIAHIERFLLELGVGFTFVGSNYRLKIGEGDFYLDLLFYHTRLRRYVVIELKSGAFKAEYAGKMSLYLTAVDEQVKAADDNPTIGLILCTSKDKVTAEYTLKNIQRPVGVATYETTNELPEQLKDQLPTPQELEAQLRTLETNDKDAG